MKKFYSFFLLLLLTANCNYAISQENTYQQANNDSKDCHTVGLTLSGGGARGMAHIGVLHIIDSLGINIDFISGTSMGAIIGGMYAAGYNAKEIEEFFLGVDWDYLFSSRLNINYLHPVLREHSGKHIVSFPIERWRIHMPTGAIEGQQLWNALGEIFFPVHLITDFAELDIPFSCVATDVETGEAIIMKDGNLVSALRASMAIPSVFTTVDRDGKTLIDGGAADNFPVTVAKEMGADLIIGVNVSHGLRSFEELRTPLDIIYQMGFFHNAKSFLHNKELTDVFIEPDLTNYSSSAFYDGLNIIEQGKIAARKNLDTFLEIKNTQCEKSAVKKRQVKDFNIVVNAIQFEGLKAINEAFVRRLIDIKEGDTITAGTVSSNINQLSATGYFDRVTYSIKQDEQTSKNTIVFKFEEIPNSRLSAAFHYRSFSGVGLTGEISNNRIFVHNLSGYTRVLLGETPELKAGLNYFVDHKQEWWIGLETHLSYHVFPVYFNFRKNAEYSQTYWNTEFFIGRLTGGNSYLRSGIAYSSHSYYPEMFYNEYLKGSLRSYMLPVVWRYNSYNRPAFPSSGQEVEVKSTFYFNQQNNLKHYNADGELIVEADTDLLTQNDFFQFFARWEKLIPFNTRYVAFLNTQGAYSFSSEKDFINMYNLGGTIPFLNKQMPFIGLNEYGVMSKSIFSAGTGLRVSLLNDFFFSGAVNAAVFDVDFLQLNKLTMENIVFGAGVNVGYLSAVGPLELTVAYSPQTSKVLAYLNLGWPF